MRVQNADSMGNDIFVIDDVVSNADTKMDGIIAWF